MSNKYNALLKEAHLANMSPDRWSESWYSLYPRVVRVGIPELQGPNAVRDFISVVGARFEPEWAHTKNVAFLQYTGELPESMKLLHLHDELKRFRENNIINQVSTGKRGVHATLGNQSDKFAGSTHYECPCDKSVGHFWKPENCRTLRQEICGEFNGRPTTFSKERCNNVVQAYESAKWKSLREGIQKHGWNQQGKKTQSKGNLPGGMAAAILDPGMFEKDDASQAPVGVYTTLGSRKHMLSMSTLYDHCGAMHVVNSVDLLVPGMYKTTENDYLEAATTNFQIIGRGTRVLKSIFNGNRGPNTEDLTLLDVAVVEGFHVNIVSASRLRAKGVWFHAVDDSLRTGAYEEKRVLAKLIGKHNLVFLEYKPLFNYSQPSQTLTLVFPPLVYSTIKLNHTHTRSLRCWHPSQDPSFPRSNSEELWHLHSGHLGKEALSKLVFNARGVKIRGTARKE
ncbi:hypothetical protein E4U60_007313, partial [Claviceps pazoutovae]